MLHRTSQKNLSRRILACCLTFGLIAAGCLTGGLLWAIRPALPTAAGPAEIWDTADIAGMALALLGPALVTALGLTVLRRTLRPLAEIERQLQRVATQPSVSVDGLRPVEIPCAVAVGWNRLLESCQGDRRGSLDVRLSGALEGFRQQKSEQILNSLPDGVAVTDEHGRVTFANKALAALLGLSNSDDTLCGRTMEECLDLNTVGAAAKELLDPGLRCRTVVAEIARSGSASQGVLRLARAPQVVSKTNGHGGHVWSVRDVTQQKLADQMRDQFVNAATHELRTPLANIKAYAETLALSEMMDVEQQKTFCNTIDDEATRLARFVDDLLHLSRMEVGSTTLNRQVTEMERLLRETVEKVRGQMEQKNIDVEVILPGKLPELVVDKDKIIVALVNLLGNAAKYTPEGGRVRLQVEIAENVLLIHVEDTGIGISVEDLPKVLDKFFRSSDPRVYELSGTGLGLSLTNEIIRLHDGKLTVQSELNKGSKFTVTLPMSAEGAKCSSA